MIRLDKVSKRYGAGAAAVENLSLDVSTGELCILVGPSGCGKTTTLKMINRLIEPTSGHIYLDDEDLAKVDAVALRRRIGYVIQQGGLFPHLRVAENVATVPRLLGWDKARVAQRVEEMLQLVGLPPDEFARRYPQELSGGQRQRVGVARALAADPPVLLMDEPFAAVDPVTRARLQQEFKALQASLRKTVVFVTHDVDEAVLLGDHIALLRVGGHLEQFGTPAELLDRPATAFVADFLGSDRGLRRLAVRRVSTAALRHPPEVKSTGTVPEAQTAAVQASSPWTAVVDDGLLKGWIPSAADGGTGLVDGAAAAVMRPVETRVEVGTSLRVAFSLLLEGTDGWVAVEEKGRFVGVLTPEEIYVEARDDPAAPAIG